MKINKYIILLVLGVFFSCEEYLESIPLSTTSPENFYKSANDAELALTGVYNILTATSLTGSANVSTYGRNLMFMLNGATDECVWNTNITNVTYSTWGLADFTAQNSFIDDSWSYFYAGINRANYLIEKLPNIDDFSGNRQAEIEGEARLLRGFYHMMLSMMHGGIPVYTSTEQGADTPRHSIEQVYQQIITDYEFAYENLDDRAGISGHVNKWTAAALLAKAHTYLASMKKSGPRDFVDKEINSFDWVNADDHYEDALVYTTDIIAYSNYILIPEYNRLFRENTKEDQYKECLFTAESSSDANQNVYVVLINAFIPQGNRDAVGGGNGWYRPTGELWDKYSSNDIRRDHNCSGNFITSASTELVDGVRYYVPRTVANPNGSTMSIGKYRMVDPAEKLYNKAYSATSLPLLRYADILLLHAEALYFTGNEPDARNMFTTVRQRSVASTSSVDDLNIAYYKANFVEELLDERARELCFENWRRIDLSRFNKYTEVIENMSDSYGYYNKAVPIIQSNWKPERIWFPIPLYQIDLNPSLIQNSEY